VRNILRADTGLVEPIGFDVNELHGSYWRNPALPNFSAVYPSQAWVGYDGGRARLLAIEAYDSYSASRLALFPENNAAAELVQQPCTRGSTFHGLCPIVGDALLITDMREHTILRPFRQDYTADDIAFFASMLVTPHDVIECERYPWIFFREEPREIDIIATKLRWS
jgi:hypothetical protein